MTDDREKLIEEMVHAYVDEDYVRSGIDAALSIAERALAAKFARIGEAADEIEKLREQLRLANIDCFNQEAANEKLRARLEKAQSFISRADWMQFFEEERESDGD